MQNINVAPFLSWYTPPILGQRYGSCDGGPVLQGNIQHNSEVSFELVRAPPPTDPAYRPKLAELAQAVNAFFSTKAKQLLADEQGLSGIEDLELTVLITKDGLQLVYARPGYPRIAADLADIGRLGIEATALAKDGGRAGSTSVSGSVGTSL